MKDSVEVAVPCLKGPLADLAQVWPNEVPIFHHALIFVNSQNFNNDSISFYVEINDDYHLYFVLNKNAQFFKKRHDKNQQLWIITTQCLN
jgi:hypothetical protein